MLVSIAPKLPMRHKATTKAYYETLGFADIGTFDTDEYLIVKKDSVEIHFFKHNTLEPSTNDGQVYIRCAHIQAWYAQLQAAGIAIHPNGPLEFKLWGQWEFSLLDPDHNLLTFGQGVSHHAL